MNTKPITFALCIILTLSFTLSACSPQAVSSPLSAALSELEGTVGIKQPGQQEFSQATGDAALQENGQVQTGEDGRVRLDLSSGTIIRMAPSSMFTLVSNEETEGGLVTKLQLEAGQVFIVLNGGSMDVETPSGVASVRGSLMGVSIDENTGDVYLTCIEGHCHGENGAGGTDMVGGQKTILYVMRPDGTYTLPEALDMTVEDFQKFLDENPEYQEFFDQAMATKTAQAPTEVPEATEEPTATEPPAVLPPQGGGGEGCVDIIGPEGGSELPHQGAVTFEWSSRPGASKYILTFHTQSGNEIEFETDETNITRYIETLPDKGTYTWDVRAIGEGGNEICKTDEVTFEKPSSHPEDLVDPKPEQECNPCDVLGECYEEGNPACYYEQGGFLPGAYYYPILYTFPFRPVLIAFPAS